MAETEKYTGLAQVLKFPLLENARKEMNYLDMARAKQDNINKEKEQKAKALYLGDYENFDNLKTFPKQDENVKEIYDNAYNKKLSLLDKYPISYLTEPPNTPEGKKFQAESRAIDFEFRANLNRQEKAIDNGFKLIEGMKKGTVLADEDVYKFTEGGKNMDLTGVGFIQPSHFQTWSGMEKGLQATIQNEVSTKTIINGKEITDTNRKRKIDVEETLKAIDTYIKSGMGELFSDSDNSLSPFDWYVAKNFTDKRKGYITLEDIHNEENRKKAKEQITQRVMRLRGITGTDIDAIKPEADSGGVSPYKEKPIHLKEEKGAKKIIGNKGYTFVEDFYPMPSDSKIPLGVILDKDMLEMNNFEPVYKKYPQLASGKVESFKIEAIVKNKSGGLDIKNYSDDQFFELGQIDIPFMDASGRYIDKNGASSLTPIIKEKMWVMKPYKETDFSNQGIEIKFIKGNSSIPKGIKTTPTPAPTTTPTATPTPVTAPTATATATKPTTTLTPQPQKKQMKETDFIKEVEAGIKGLADLKTTDKKKYDTYIEKLKRSEKYKDTEIIL